MQFLTDQTIIDEAYSSSWNGVSKPPTKNAVYDKIQSLTLGGSGGLVYTNSSVPGGNTLTSTSETAFASTYSLPLDQLSVGDLVRIKLYGVYSGTVLPTITGKIKIGSTILLTTGSLTGLVTGTNLGWWAEAICIVQATGASGSIEAQGYTEFSTAATTGLSVNLANSSPITVDTTAAQTLSVTIQWGAGGTGQTITLREIAIFVGKVSGIADGVSTGDKGDITVTAGGLTWTIDNSVITDTKVASGIDAVKLADGSVTNAEFQYLGNVTSDIQTQLNSAVSLGKIVAYSAGNRGF